MVDSIVDLRRRFYGGGADAEYRRLRGFLRSNNALNFNAGVCDDTYGFHKQGTTAPGPTPNIGDLRYNYWGGGVDKEYAGLAAAYTSNFPSLTGWTDLYSFYGATDLLPVVDTGDGNVGITTAPFASGSGVYGPGQRGGHCILGRSMGSANGELSVEFVIPTSTHGYSQIAPCFGMNLTGAGSKIELGVALVSDIGLGYGFTYAQNAFSGPIANIFDTTGQYFTDQDVSAFSKTSVGSQIGTSGCFNRGAYSAATAYVRGDVVQSGGSSYMCLANHTNQPLPTGTIRLVADTAYWRSISTRRQSSAAGAETAYGVYPTPPGTTRGWPTTFVCTVRVVNGWFVTYMDGAQMHHPSPMPTWAAGRDGWGFHVVDITWDPASNVPPPGGIANAHFRVKQVTWRPYSKPLFVV